MTKIHKNTTLYLFSGEWNEMNMKRNELIVYLLPLWAQQRLRFVFFSFFFLFSSCCCCFFFLFLLVVVVPSFSVDAVGLRPTLYLFSGVQRIFVGGRSACLTILNRSMGCLTLVIIVFLTRLNRSMGQKRMHQ